MASIIRKRRPGDHSAAWVLLPLALFALGFVLVHFGVDVPRFMDSLSAVVLGVALLAVIAVPLWWLLCAVIAVLLPRYRSTPCAQRHGRRLTR
ncbi:hypothetical protein [Sinimarinibacterium flocculans]|uniref:hypothetical protein n=1 Tax=Sinimarinibacterium flocculans TaxID=985250 RepID=UPI0035176B18